MQVLVSNLQEEVPTDESTEQLIIQVVEAVLRAEHKTDADKEVEVSVALVDNPYIQELNNIYRGKDCPTDVLSFAMNESTEDEPDWSDELEEVEVLGDIIISMEKAISQAGEYGHTVDRELAFLTTHGVLHLLGYDHEEEADRVVMRAREDAILAELQINR